MMLLERRRTDLTERMDDPDCDLQKLERTYRHFTTLNRLIAGWSGIYKIWIRPRLKAGPATLLDIGCGGGDVARYLHHQATRDGLALTATGIDPDARAIAYARRQDNPAGVHFRQVHSSEVSESFDFVVSNHLLHHLTGKELTRLAGESARLSRTAAIHNDLHRHPVAYAGHSVLGLAFPGSFIREDGLTSLRRAYTPAELKGALPDGWRVENRFPFRLLAIHEA